MATITERAEKFAIGLFFSDTEGIEKIEDLTEKTAQAWYPFEDWEFSELVAEAKDTAEAFETQFYAACAEFNK